MKRLLMALLLVLAGCAAQTSYVDRAEQAIKNSQWEVAYRFLEDGFTSNKPETKSRALSLFNAYPEIRTAAATTFSNDSLSNSRVRFGARISWEIETNRLQLYMQAANHTDYEMAKANMEHIFADIANQEAERKLLAQLSEEKRQKIADEKRKTDEADSVRRRESRLRTQHALEVVSDQARFMCKDRIDCDKAFSLTQIYIVNNSDMKIQVANETIIETYNATEGMNISMKAIKIPRAGSAAEIILSVNCRDEGKESYKDVCNSKSLIIYSGYPQFVQKNLIR